MYKTIRPEVAAEVLKSLDADMATISAKAFAEYAADHDMFENFTDTARLLNLDQEQVLLVLLHKHMRGIASYFRGKRNQREPIETRIIDAINYLRILYLMVWVEAKEGKNQ